jgi:hypothetical protein
VGTYVVAGGGTDFVVATDTSNHVIKKISLGSTPTITTLAGQSGVQATAVTNGFGADAKFWRPTAIALTADGKNAVVSDSLHVVRSINVETGEVKTLAGSVPTSVFYKDGTGTDALFYSLSKIERVGDDFYASSSGYNYVRKVTFPGGVATTVLGVAGVNGNADGYFPFGFPTGSLNGGIYYLSPDGSYFMYASDWMKIIRKVTIATKYVETLAGSYHTDGCVNGLGMDSQFGMPGKILFLDNNYVLLADPLTFTIRKIRTDTGGTSLWIGNCDDTGTTGVDATGANVRIAFNKWCFRRTRRPYTPWTQHCCGNSTWRPRRSQRLWLLESH